MSLPLIWLAIAAFAIGTEGFMIAGLLPVLAADLGITLAAAGQLVSIFSLAYALGSPLLAALTGAADRRRVLVGALGSFAAANLLAAGAHTFAELALARVVLALTAGLFMPAANAVAASIVPPDRRARAIAVVTTGGTVAVALGVPLGSWIASGGNWRATFLLVGGFAALATLGLALGLPRDLPRGAATLAERVAAARLPGVLAALAVSALWSSGGFTFYTYVSPFLASTAGFGPSAVGWVLCLIGVSAAIGTAISGQATDHIGVRPIVFTCAGLLIATLGGLSLAALALNGTWAMVAIVALTSLWAMAGWGFGPAQATRLIQLAPAVAPVTLSLHASAVYLGIAVGSSLGAATIETAGVRFIGFAAALCQAVCLVLLLFTARRAAPRSSPTEDALEDRSHTARTSFPPVPGRAQTAP